jgi:DNA-binding beta-propeller fold protein YncE
LQAGDWKERGPVASRPARHRLSAVATKKNEEKAMPWTRSLMSCVLTLAAISAGTAECRAAGFAISDLAFMSGCWKGDLAGREETIEEHYGMPAAGVMLGTSHVIGGGRTRFFEFIKVEQAGDEVVMTPMPNGQKSAGFTLVRLEGKKAVFQSLEHAFPKRIIYGLTAGGDLLARIEGDDPGKARDFPMKPIECGATNLASFQLKWGEAGKELGQYDRPGGIALFKDQFGVTTMIFADTNNHQLRSFTWNGMFIDKWGVEGSGEGEFRFPQSLTVNHEGEVVIADSGNDRIQVTAGSPPDLTHLPGTFKRIIGKSGSGDGELRNPLAVAVDSHDNIYVVDTDNNRIQKFSPDGKFLAKWGQLGREAGEFNQPSGIAIDADDRVYVSDTDNYRVQKFDAAGKFLLEWGKGGSRYGELFRAKGIGVSPQGMIYVADANNHRIQKFSPAGKFMGAFGSRGGEDGELSFPLGVAVDERGNIFVTDSGNGRIEVFHENPAVAQLYREH